MTVYPGFTNSPPTTLSGDITNVATTIPVVELGVFPAAPNIAVIGTGIDAETIFYAGKSAASGSGNLTSVTREFDKTGTYGAKKAWGGGSVIARNFCKVDLDAVQERLYDHTYTISPSGGNYTSIQAALTAHATEYTLFQVYPGSYTNDTIYFTANNQSVIGLDNSTTEIVGSATTNVVDFGAFTGCVLGRVTVRITGATSGISTIKGTTGSIIIDDCTLEMTNASVTGATQPSVLNISGAGSATILFGFINYTNTVAIGSNIKVACIMGAGSSLNFKRGEITIVTSGASGGVTVAYGATTGILNASRTNLTMTDTDTGYVTGFNIAGSGVTSEISNCNIRCNGGTTLAAGVYISGTTTLRTFYNHIHVTSASKAYAFYVSSGCTLHCAYGDWIAADGVYNDGTYANVPFDSPTFTGTVVLPLTTSIGLVTSTELGYIDGVTSAIQTQMDLKAPLASPTFTGTVVLPSTTSIGTVSNTEISYVDGVTSAIQTQMDLKAAKASPTFTGTVTLPAVTLSGNINTVTPTELSYVHNVTSAIQTQIDGITLGTSSKPTYDAIVYQDATTTYALLKDGTVLSSGLISAQTDDVQIQAAITTITDPALGLSSAKLYIAPGSYSISTAVKLYNSGSGYLVDNLHIDGGYALFTAIGMGDINNFSNESVTDDNVMFGMHNADAGIHRNYTIENMVIDGGSCQGINGIGIHYGGGTIENVTIRNVTVMNCHCYNDAGEQNGAGINLVRVSNSIIENCYCYGNETGIILDGQDNSLTTSLNLRITNCKLKNNIVVTATYRGLGIYYQRYPGLVIDGNTIDGSKVGIYAGEGALSDVNTVIVNNTITLCTESGINLGGITYETLVANNFIYGNTGSGMNTGISSHIIGNVFKNNGTAAGGGQTQAAVVCVADTAAPYVNAIVVKNNHFIDDQVAPTQIYGVYHHPSTSTGDEYYWIIHENTFEATTPASVTPISILNYAVPHVDIKRNYGYVTEKQGRTSVTLASGSGVISHGLVATPTWAILTCSTSGDSANVTSFDGTNITLHVTKGNNTNGTTQYINWMCGI